MAKETFELTPNGNHHSKFDLVDAKKPGSSSHVLALGTVGILTVGAVIITALVLTLGDNGSSNSGNANPIVGLTDPPVESKPPATSCPTNAPPTDAHQTNPPGTKTHETNPPVTNAHQTSAPKTSAHQTSPPATNAHQTSPPATNAHQTSSPATNAHQTSPPVTSAAETSPPATSAPETSLPATSSPETSLPATSAPQTSLPATSSPETTLPSSTTSPGGGIPSQCSMYPCDSSCDMTSAPCNGLIFQEEFDTLNLDIWQHELTAGGGGNWEFQYYTNNRSNSYVRDGVLYIKPTLTEDRLGTVTSGTLDLWGASPANLCTGNAWYGCSRTGSASNILNPIQSARLRTVESFSFKYGRLEVEAKLPTGDWLWPAIWLLSKHNEYGDWPASGEIDLVESRGNLDLKDGDGVSVGVDQMGSTMHWGPFWPQNGWPKTHATKNLDGGRTFGSDFHKYTLDWTKDSLKFYVDDELILNVDPSSGFWDLGEFDTAAPGIDNPWAYSTNKLVPFDQEFYLILNVAVGGTNYFGDGLVSNPPKPWLNTSPTASKDFWDAKDQWLPTWSGEDAAMQVNYIRVYAHPGQTTYHLRDR